LGHSSSSSSSLDDWETIYPTLNTTYVKTTNYLNASYYGYFTCDGTKSLTGAAADNQWCAGINANQKFNIDLQAQYHIKRIYYENGHESGDASRSAKTVIIYGTDTNFSTVYSSLTGLTELWSGTFDQHVGSDVPDPKYIYLSGTTAYRYYIFRIADSWGGEEDDYISIRRIELQVYKF